MNYNPKCKKCKGKIRQKRQNYNVFLINFLSDFWMIIPYFYLLTSASTKRNTSESYCNIIPFSWYIFSNSVFPVLMSIFIEIIQFIVYFLHSLFYFLILSFSFSFGFASSCVCIFKQFCVFKCILFLSVL